MKPKIVFIASYPPSLLNFRLELMQAFIAEGYEVIAIAPHEESVAAALVRHNIKFIPVSMQRNGLNPFLDLKLISNLTKILRNENPSAIFSYTLKPVIYGSIAGKLADIKNIYSMITGTGYIFLNHNLKSRVIGLIARSMFRVALYFNRLVFFQNQDNLLFFQKSKIISTKKLTAVVNGSGINCEKFFPASYPNDISFLMIARFLHDKGIREYVEAAKIIKQCYPEIKFKLAGWIDSNPNSITQQQLDEWVNEGVIEHLGQLEDVKPAIADSSVYVLPSYHEGTPRTVLEAMAMARPIITTNAPGCKETVVPQKNGFLVAAKNVSELVAAMKFFIQSPYIIKEMGAKSREIALEKYDVKKVNQSMLKAMQVI